MRETRNLYNNFPEVVKELDKRLENYSPPEQERGRGNREPNPAKKTPATSSSRTASFDFESGTREP